MKGSDIRSLYAKQIERETILFGLIDGFLDKVSNGELKFETMTQTIVISLEMIRRVVSGGFIVIESRFIQPLIIAEDTIRNYTIDKLGLTELSDIMESIKSYQKEVKARFAK